MTSDAIELRGIRLLGRHGVGDTERQSAQPFELDLDVTVDTSLAASSDDVGDTVDYQGLVEVASEVVTGASFRLLETLASAIADALLSVGRVEQVTVSVRKLRPPVAFDIRSAGVRITRALRPRQGLHRARIEHGRQARAHKTRRRRPARRGRGVARSTRPSPSEVRPGRARI